MAYLLHSLIVGIAVGAAVDSEAYGLAAIVFVTTVVQILWAISEKK